ncbi:hypothetical protein B6U74_05155 [Candidatus Bathyarchaeota archaeon ex4484_205]|nr:MAG: hypothetical protein B6U74_05155 [Candidatus Bathyarchaeota archaeon ex4484_205]
MIQYFYKFAKNLQIRKMIFKRRSAEAEANKKGSVYLVPVGKDNRFRLILEGLEPGEYEIRIELPKDVKYKYEPLVWRVTVPGGKTQKP